MAALSLLGRLDANQRWTLVGEDEQAAIYLPPTASGPIRLAVSDLVSDVKKITGKALRIEQDLRQMESSLIVIANLAVAEERELVLELDPGVGRRLEGRWESYVVSRGSPNKYSESPLHMVGSDERGTIFALYHFVEEYLQVDPFYYWTGMEPEAKEELAFEEIEIVADEPAFKYRGWFLNDEDLISEFFDGGGERDIDYRYYGQVTHPELMSRILEALARSRYNLIIPASFIDIMNPPERRLVDEAVKRGLFISQHHVEPVGVSGFTFRNYWEERGKKPTYSLHSSRDEIMEVWEKYIAEWSQIPNVVWQVGLRGIADSPMWLEDADIPDTDQARGELISDAMQVQVDLINKYDERENPPMTTTLWAEGTSLVRGGHLDFPDGVTVVFADNNPGHIWLDDFYETTRQPERNYGVYFHHQLWGSGPHLAQGVSPAATYEMFKIAYEHDSRHYALLNVSNVREFVLGIEASSSILLDLPDFDPDAFLEDWCESRFAEAGGMAKEAYECLFSCYQISSSTGTPYTLDGQLKSFGRSELYDLQSYLRDPEAYYRDFREIKAAHEWWHTEPYIFPGRFMYHAAYAAGVEKQIAVLEQCELLIARIENKLEGDALEFFRANFKAQFYIVYGLSQWCHYSIKAKGEVLGDDRASGLQCLQRALAAVELAEKGMGIASQGKWKNWYRGDRKFNMAGVKVLTKETLQMLESWDEELER